MSVMGRGQMVRRQAVVTTVVVFELTKSIYLLNEEHTATG